MRDVLERGVQDQTTKTKVLPVLRRSIIAWFVRRITDEHEEQAFKTRDELNDQICLVNKVFAPLLNTLSASDIQRAIAAKGKGSTPWFERLFGEEGDKRSP